MLDQTKDLFLGDRWIQRMCIGFLTSIFKVHFGRELIPDLFRVIQPWWLGGRVVDSLPSATVGSNLRQAWCINRSVEENLCYNSNCRTPGPFGVFLTLNFLGNYN